MLFKNLEIQTQTQLNNGQQSEEVCVVPPYNGFGAMPRFVLFISIFLLIASTYDSLYVFFSIANYKTFLTANSSLILFFRMFIKLI